MRKVPRLCRHYHKVTAVLHNPGHDSSRTPALPQPLVHFFRFERRLAQGAARFGIGRKCVSEHCSVPHEATFHFSIRIGTQYLVRCSIQLRISAPLMTIADLSNVFMAADVPESQIRLVTPAEIVKISLSAYPDEVFNGKVARIADVVDPETRTIKVHAALNNAHGRLRPDMFGEIRHEETFRRVPVIPSSAIVQSDKRSIVYREKSAGVYEPVTITFGKQNGDRVPVLTGLTEGDRIVIDGGMLLKGVK